MVSWVPAWAIAAGWNIWLGVPIDHLVDLRLRSTHREALNLASQCRYLVRSQCAAPEASPTLESVEDL